MVDLSIILISRNQEWNISRLIESILRIKSYVPSSEIVLVDSASSDQTVNIACHYPIRILKINPKQRLTASAGRWVGYAYTTGDLILFLDGDMELCNGWIEQASNIIHTMTNVAVITSPWINLPTTDHNDNKNKDLSPLVGENHILNRPIIGGAALYKRSVLEKVGTFNPYLYSDEEPELAVRILHAGYQIYNLGFPIAFHYTDPQEAISTLVSRWRRNLYLGMGQNIRYHMGDKLLWPYLRERGSGILPLIYFLVGFLSFGFSLLSGKWLFISLWFLSLISIAVILVIRKRNLYRAIYSMVQRLFVLDGTIRGFLLRPEKPDLYRVNLEIIQKEA